MIRYKFDPEFSCMNEHVLSSEIAHLLDDAQIPNVIWNWLLLHLYGVPTMTCVSLLNIYLYGSRYSTDINT